LKRNDWRCVDERICTQAVVGNSVNWVEAAETLTELAGRHDIAMNEPVYFGEPYVGLDHVMPSVVDHTHRSTRSTLPPCSLTMHACTAGTVSVRHTAGMLFCGVTGRAMSISCCANFPLKIEGKGIAQARTRLPSA